MHLYLSSYRIGNEAEKLKAILTQTNNRVGYIPNALDFTKADRQKCLEVRERDMAALRELGIEVELLDLKDYFDKSDELRRKIASLGGVWVSGGNTFVLRQAMKLSGLDTILHELTKREDFVYGGYSAAGCVLSPTLEAYQIVDDPTDLPYPEQREVLWDGLGLIHVAFMPHFDSDHGESADIDKEIALCKEKNIPYKALRDGEVWIIE